MSGSRVSRSAKVGRIQLSAEEGLQYRGELPGVEGLGKKVTPEGAVSLCSLVAIQGGHDHPDGIVGGSFVGAEPVQDRSTLAVGELKVEDRGVRGLLLEDAKGLAAGRHLGRVKPGLAEAEAQYSGDHLVVLDEKHLRPAISRHRCRRLGLH